jgi:transposase InsO family protein
VAGSLKESGCTVKEACSLARVSRSRYYLEGKPKEKSDLKLAPDELSLTDKIKELKTAHPFWGYRRVSAWLRRREGFLINQKRVRRIMKEHDLMADRKTCKAKRKPTGKKPKAMKPLQFWGIDMTKFIVGPLGWVYLVIVLDWHTKKVVGWDLSLRTKTEDWKRALDMALSNEFPDGVRGKGLKLISDNGCQPTSTAFVKEMKNLDIVQIFTSYNNPKGNAETERMMRTVKEELLWLEEFESFEEAQSALKQWIETDYNRDYVHSALGYLSPLEFEEQYNADSEMQKAEFPIEMELQTVA